MSSTSIEFSEVTRRRHRTLWGVVWFQLRKHKLTMFGMVMLIILVLGAFLGPLFYTREPEFIDILFANQQPNRDFLFGTDMLVVQMHQRPKVGQIFGNVNLLITLDVIFKIKNLLKFLDGIH